MKKASFLLLVLFFACQENTNQQAGKTAGNQELTRLFNAIDKFKISAEDSIFKGYHLRTAWVLSRSGKEERPNFKR